MPRRATPRPTKGSASLLTCHGALSEREAKATRASAARRREVASPKPRHDEAAGRERLCCEAGVAASQEGAARRQGPAPSRELRFVRRGCGVVRPTPALRWLRAGDVGAGLRVVG